MKNTEKVFPDKHVIQNVNEFVAAVAFSHHTDFSFQVPIKFSIIFGFMYTNQI